MNKILLSAALLISANACAMDMIKISPYRLTGAYIGQLLTAVPKMFATVICNGSEMLTSGIQKTWKMAKLQIGKAKLALGQNKSVVSQLKNPSIVRKVVIGATVATIIGTAFFSIFGPSKTAAEQIAKNTGKSILELISPEKKRD